MIKNQLAVLINQKTFESAFKRNTKFNKRFIQSEEGKTSMKFLEIVGNSALVLTICAAIGIKVGILIGGPAGAKIGAGAGAGIGLIGFCVATIYYTITK